MAKKNREICPYCKKSFVYLNRHNCDLYGVNVSAAEARILRQLNSKCRNYKIRVASEGGHVTSLGMSACDLKSLPDSIGQLIHLKKLDLSNNRFGVSQLYEDKRALPDSLGQLF